MDFNELLKPLGISLNETQLKQFALYYSFLIEYNEKINLTAITNENDVYIKHFYDSLLLAKNFDFTQVKSLCDVGAGAGFPSVPIKILYPHLNITIVDSLNKRIVFLEKLCDKLSLDNVCLKCARAEEFSREKRESFDVVTARAVARQNILNELCIPLVKVGGTFLSMKGKLASEELMEGNSLEILNGKIVSKEEYFLPYDEGSRMIIQIKHFKATPVKYPRGYAMIKKKPL